MKFYTKTIALLAIVSLSIMSCKKEARQENPPAPDNSVSAEVKAKITALGYTSSNAIKVDEGYLVEGDIILTEEDLNSVPENIFLRIADEEQYRTNNLVGGLPRNIT